MPFHFPASTLLALSLLLLQPVHARQPNVILIMADDLGYHDLGCYGHPSIKTTVLDQLASKGIRLTSFYAGATVCTPSRMALLTGAYPVRLGWTRGVVGYKMGRGDGMNPEALTIAEILRGEGYATAISGKWHLGNQPETRPHRQGFESAYYIDLSNNQTKKLWRDDEVIEVPFVNRMLTEQFTDEAIRFLREHGASSKSGGKRKPFFLYLPYSAPHFPVEPHPDWKGRSAFGAYGDVVEELDASVGRLLVTLKDLELEKETIVVFTSDNGPNPREKAGSLPFRGEKWSALEGGTRVPCIISWPGVIPPGTESDALVAAIDLLPTLCHAAGIDAKNRSRGKPKIDGFNVWATLLGKTGTHPRTELLYWHGMDPEPQAIRAGDWKLFFDRRQALEGLGTDRMTAEQAARIKPYRETLKADVENPPILFNLRDDPGETVDLNAKHPGKVEELRRRAEVMAAAIKADPILPIAVP